MAGKEEGLAENAGRHGDFINVSKFKNMALYDSSSNMDTFRNLTDFTGQDGVGAILQARET